MKSKSEKMKMVSLLEVLEKLAKGEPYKKLQRHDSRVYEYKHGSYISEYQDNLIDDLSNEYSTQDMLGTDLYVVDEEENGIRKVENIIMKNKGFTLIELLAVIIIFTILILIIGGRY